MISDGQSTGRGSRVSRVVGFAKAHRNLALVDPRLTKTMGRVRNGALVDVPKGTVVVGDRLLLGLLLLLGPRDDARELAWVQPV